MERYTVKWFLKGCYNHITTSLNKIIYYISLVFPIKNNMILFESQPDYTDNSYFLYLYLQKHSFMDIEWISDTMPCNKEVNITYNLKNGFHPLTYHKIATAKYIFFSHSFPYFWKKKKKQVVIYMTHGCPIKKNKLNNNTTPPDNYIKRSNFDYALCIGEGAVMPQARFCMCKPSMILPLGYPRNDFLILKKGNSSSNPFMKNIDGKLIIWMPTFRASNFKSLSENRSQSKFGLPILKSKIDLDYLNSFLKDNRTRLLIKIHRLQANYPVFNLKYSNIDFITDSNLSEKKVLLYEIIGKTDALLTDYSSIYFDYLLIDRPIGFTLDDYHEYMADRGFVFEDLKSQLVGYHIYSLDDMIQFFNDVINNKDKFKEARNEIKHHFHNDTPISSSERIARYFKLTNYQS